MNTLGLLAADIGVHERTLRRALRSGTLKGSRSTPQRLDVSVSELAYARRSWPLLASLRQALRTERNVGLAVLFGSAARGDGSRTSDVDLLVALRNPSLERLVDLSDKLRLATARPIDLVRLEEAEQEPGLLAEIVSGGRVLVDRQRVWPRLRASEATLRRRAEREAPGRLEAALAGLDRLTTG